MNCNIFRVQFANNFHIFLHIRHGLPGKAGDEVHIDDGKSQLPAVFIHGVNRFDAMAPAQGIEEVLLQGLGIDADAVDAGLAEHGQHVRRRRIGTARFDRPFAGFREIPGQPRHHRFQDRQGQARRRPAADIERRHFQIIGPAQVGQVVEVGQDGIAESRKRCLPFPADEARREGTVQAVAGAVRDADV